MVEEKLSKERITEFELSLLKFLLDKVKAGDVSFEHFQDISSDIIHYGEEIEVEGQLALIVHKLAEKWPVFSAFEHSYK